MAKQDNPKAEGEVDVANTIQTKLAESMMGVFDLEPIRITVTSSPVA